MPRAVLDDLKAFGCSDGVMSLVRDLPKDTPVVRLPSKATNYIALSCAEGHQVAIYVHTSSAGIALDPQDADHVATATGAGLQKRNARTWYVMARGSLLPCPDLTGAAAAALERSKDLHAPDDHDDQLYSLDKDAVCPVHNLVLPLTGECQC